MRPNEMLMWQKLHQLESERQDQKLERQANRTHGYTNKGQRVLTTLGTWRALIAGRLQSSAGNSHTCVCEPDR